MKKLTKILCALLVVLTMSCAKDGATGPAGPAGTNGTNGTDGNANVKVLLWNTPPTGVFASASRYDFEFVQSDITTDIINNGAILIYLSFGSTSWDYAPFWYSATNYASVYFLKSPAKIVVASSASSISKTRIVLIGGPVGGTTVVNRSKPWNSLTEIEKAQSLYPNVDFTNYENVKQTFKFKE